MRERFSTAAFVLVFLALADPGYGAPALALIQDLLYKADGSRFEGVAFIQWKSFQTADQSNIPAQSLTVSISDGSLRVQLVPTVNATPAAYYEVRYNSDGRTQFTEYWAVPQSQSSLRLRDIRIPAPVSGTSIAPPVNVAVLIGDVVGLREELDARPVKGVGYVASRTLMANSSGALTSVSGGASDCVHVDGTSSPCGSASQFVFVDSETPGGIVDAVNTAFTLSGAPNPGSSLMLYRNGVLQTNGSDYVLAGAALTLTGISMPRPGDVLQAWYRKSGTAAAATAFADAETPSGVLNGSNATFTLAATPNPASSVQVFRNGVLQRNSIDFSVNGATLIFAALSIPQPGDLLQVWYRY